MMAMGYFASSTTTKRKIKKFAESDTEKWKSGRATFWRRRRWRKWKNPIFNELNFFGNTEAEWENIVKDRDARQKQKYRKNKILIKFYKESNKFGFVGNESKKVCVLFSLRRGWGPPIREIGIEAREVSFSILRFRLLRSI